MNFQDVKPLLIHKNWGFHSTLILWIAAFIEEKVNLLQWESMEVLGINHYCHCKRLVTPRPPEGNPRMMPIAKGNTHNTTHMQLVMLCTRVRLFVKIGGSFHASGINTDL